MKGSDKSALQCQIVEVIDVKSWEDWQKVLKSEDFKPVIEAWNKVGGSGTPVALYGDDMR